MTNKTSREELNAKLIASGVDPKCIRMGQVFQAIRDGVGYPDDMTDSQAWEAEDALRAEGKIYRDERTGDLTAA